MTDKPPEHSIFRGVFLMAENKLLTLSEVCELVGLSHTSIHRLRVEGDFPVPVRLGRATIRWRRGEVEKWLASRPRATDRVKRKTASQGAA